jgi:DUF4097 and DUF4098 domain-containing protein YvlB
MKRGEIKTEDYSNLELPGKENMVMRKLLVITLLPFFFCACTVANFWENDVRAEDRESRSFSSSQIRKVEVNTKNGRIESSAWDDNSIYVVFEKWATGHDTEDAEGNVDDIKIYINEDNDSGVLSIDVNMPRSHTGKSYGCDVSLNLPFFLSLDLDTSNGAIAIWEIQSDIYCSTSNGAITMEDTEGYAELRTSNGKIMVKNHYGELSGRTSNGEISADVLLPGQGQCILKTSNGAITLSIPAEGTSAMIEASTSNGKVEINGLDVTVTKMQKTEFNGKIGSGEGDIELETSNGNITLRGR